MCFGALCKTHIGASRTPNSYLESRDKVRMSFPNTHVSSHMALWLIAVGFDHLSTTPSEVCRGWLRQSTEPPEELLPGGALWSLCPLRLHRVTRENVRPPCCC